MLHLHQRSHAKGEIGAAGVVPCIVSCRCDVRLFWDIEHVTVLGSLDGVVECV